MDWRRVIIFYITQKCILGFADIMLVKFIITSHLSLSNIDKKLCVILFNLGLIECTA